MHISCLQVIKPLFDDIHHQLAPPPDHKAHSVEVQVAIHGKTPDIPCSSQSHWGSANTRPDSRPDSDRRRRLRLWSERRIEDMQHATAPKGLQRSGPKQPSTSQNSVAGSEEFSGCG